VGVPFLRHALFFLKILMYNGQKGGSRMVKELMHDPIFLARKSEPATQEDLGTARDLLDTLTAHRETCVGMAANMIGVCKRIIAFDNEGTYMVMLNPEIVKKSGEYDAEESCLSLLGGPRKTKRYQKIKVQYQTEEFKTRLKTFEGWTAQIIQHEIDHCNGILI
jgi:peptide deformylase